MEEVTNNHLLIKDIEICYFDIFPFTSLSHLSIIVGTSDNCSSELISPSKTTFPFGSIALSEVSPLVSI